MSDLFAARAQMGISLAFHMVFAALGIGMPLLMLIADGTWRRTRDPVALDLAKRWAKATAILFAIGAVSGTVLSFELGLLWPEFMRLTGAIIGLPFSLEGFAFFAEAIFLGIVLYGRGRVSDRVHFVSVLLVAVSGAASGVFVLAVNSWMNTPTGFRWEEGRAVDIDPWAAMANTAWIPMTLHMLLAAWLSTAAAVAGVSAWMLLREGTNALHRRALEFALWVMVPTALLQPLSGDLSAKLVAKTQPAKLAAMEGQYRTEDGAPLRIGGWPDDNAMKTRWAIEIPRGLSFLAFGDPDARVTGLEEFPRDDWPNVRAVHLAFQLMVGCGSVLALAALVVAWQALRRRSLPTGRKTLRLLVLSAPLGFVATEAGWVVTEVGRQPWVVQGILRTSDVVTPMKGLVVPLVVLTLLYVFLAVVVVALLRRQVLSSSGKESRRDTNAHQV